MGMFWNRSLRCSFMLSATLSVTDKSVFLPGISIWLRKRTRLWFAVMRGRLLMCGSMMLDCVPAWTPWRTAHV